VSEKTCYQLANEFVQGKPPELFNAKWFMCQLKIPTASRPTVVSGSTALSSDDLTKLADLSKQFYELSNALMDVEKFFREDLAVNASHVAIGSGVQNLLNKLNEMRDKVIKIIDELEYKGLDLYQLEDALNVIDQLRGDLYLFTESLYGYLVYVNDLFADTPVSSTYMEYTVNFNTLIKKAKEDKLFDLATDLEKYEIKLGKLLLDPETTDIALGNRKIKQLYLGIKDIKEKFYDKYSDIASHGSVFDFLRMLNDIEDSLYSMLEFATRIVQTANRLRNIVKRFGYISPSQRLAFFLPSHELQSEADMLREIPDDLSFALLFNDIAYVIHRIAEMLIFYAKYIDDTVNNPRLVTFNLGNCPVHIYSVINAGPLFDFATAWLNTLCNLIDSGWVKPEDMESLGGYIIDDTRGWFRVGSMPGHATHVSKINDMWVVRYYDMDKSVNALLAKLWRAIPGTEVEVQDDGVIVRTKYNWSLPFIGAILGFATSLDINIRDLGRNVYNTIIRNAERITPQLSLITKTALSA
jgi:hypothetical protein